MELDTSPVHYYVYRSISPWSLWSQNCPSYMLLWVYKCLSVNKPGSLLRWLGPFKARPVQLHQLSWYSFTARPAGFHASKFAITLMRTISSGVYNDVVMVMDDGPWSQSSGLWNSHRLDSFLAAWLVNLGNQLICQLPWHFSEVISDSLHHDLCDYCKCPELKAGWLVVLTKKWYHISLSYL